MVVTIFTLLLLFQLKHFIADFPLQGQYMLGKFKGGTEWVLPLVSHGSVHAIGTFIISILFVGINTALSLAMLDFVLHITMDRIKASPNLLGRFTPDNRYFWWSLGFDQMVHHLTHYLLIILILASM